jgi:hypothetical protein
MPSPGTLSCRVLGSVRDVAKESSARDERDVRRALHALIDQFTQEQHARHQRQRDDHAGRHQDLELGEVRHGGGTLHLLERHSVGRIQQCHSRDLL